jgi:hypothetical protein
VTIPESLSSHLELGRALYHRAVLRRRSGHQDRARADGERAYAVTIMNEAAKLGRRLATEGVFGRFAIDFVAVRDEGSDWQTYAIELNLRKGGTTDPLLTLQFLTDGSYDAEDGLFRTPRGI